MGILQCSNVISTVDKGYFHPRHKRIWMRSLGGAAMANDALITQSSTMKRLFCPNNPSFFALISINLELQGGPVPPRPPHQIRLCLQPTEKCNLSHRLSSLSKR